MGPSPLVDLEGGAEAKITFSEYGHVEYQIKANGVCSSMVANILPTNLTCLHNAVCKTRHWA